MLTGPNAVRKYCNIYYSEWWWNIQLRERRQRRQRRRQCWTAKTFNTLFRTARTFLPLGDIAWPHHQATSPSHGVHEIAYILIKHVRPEYNEVKHKNNRILVLCTLASLFLWFRMRDYIIMLQLWELWTCLDINIYILPICHICFCHRIANISYLLISFCLIRIQKFIFTHIQQTLSSVKCVCLCVLLAVNGNRRFTCNPSTAAAL